MKIKDAILISNIIKFIISWRQKIQIQPKPRPKKSNMNYQHPTLFDQQFTAPGIVNNKLEKVIKLMAVVVPRKCISMNTGS